MTFVDTAGVHSGAVDPVELEGIARAVAVRDVASVLVIVLDQSRPLDADDYALLDSTRERPRVVVANKADAPAAWDSGGLQGIATVDTSATAATGIDRLRAAIVEAAAGEPLRDAPTITNIASRGSAGDARAALGASRKRGADGYAGRVRSGRLIRGATPPRGSHRGRGRRTMCSMRFSIGSALANRPRRGVDVEVSYLVQQSNLH